MLRFHIVSGYQFGITNSPEYRVIELGRKPQLNFQRWRIETTSFIIENKFKHAN